MHSKRIAAAGLLMAALLPLSASASGLRLTPLRLDLSASQTSNQIELANFGSEVVPVQVSVHAWSQVDGVDTYTPSKDIFFAPPIVSVPAGGKAIVRFRLRTGAPKDVARPYRVYFHETAPPKVENRGGMSFRLKLGVPLFVMPVKPGSPRLEINGRTRADAVTLTVANTGQTHAKVLGMELYPAGVNRLDPRGAVAAASHSRKGSNYLLPGSHHEWAIPLPAKADPARHVLLVRTDDYTGKSIAGIDNKGWLWMPLPAFATGAP